MSKARTLANLISDNAELADGQISVAEVVGAAPLASPTFTGTASGTFSGPLTGNVTGDLTGNVTGAVTGDVTAPEIDLSAISSTISDTAVDIFVYDTRRDSDGGKWRQRTQHTSWYNEAASATRGSRKEFPAVAVIVAESGTVTIYDGDDPDLPMWMVFNGTGDYGSYLGRTSGANVTAVHMLNGVLCVSRGNSGFGEALLRADFIKEFSVNYAVSGWLQLLPISGRNEGSNSNVQLNYTGINPIVNIAVNDVAMTVLPNAPTDAATGLPVPTIAVATNGGVSVIKDDGTVVDLTDSVGGKSTKVMFTQDGKLAYAHDGATNIRIDSIPSSDFVYGSSKVARGSSEEFYVNSSLISSGWSGETPKILSGSFAHNGLIVKSDSNFGLAQTGSNGLTRLDRSLGESGRAKNMVQYTTSSYNTGWMNGDIKLATLSDTDDTNVTGTSLAANGTFSSDTSWTKGEQWTISGGSASITDSPNRTSDSYLEQNISGLVAGKQYVIRITYSGSIGDIDAYLGGNRVFSIRSTYGNSADLYLNLTAGSSNTKFAVVANQHFVGSVDNFELYEAVQDRSVNGNGLQVFGTVTKSAVSSGADLVAYSGFSASNYLKQPHNDDLSFGVDDFAVMGWAYPQQTSGTAGYLFDRGDSSGHSRVAIYIAHTNMQVTFYTTNSSGAAAFYQEANGWTDSRWLHLCMVRRGTTVFNYIDGKLVGSFTQSNSLNNDNAPLVIGNRYNYGNPFIGKLSLIRWSATAPSPEQIKKIYEDEKVLFQDGAQATLYGSSDAVTALAYDDSTELLHVGTSAGRSVFQGLRRVDNTTDAVGAAISASNGLVAED